MKTLLRGSTGCAIAACVALAACTSNSQTAIPPSSTAPAMAESTSAVSATLSIAIPHQGLRAPRPHYVSPATRSTSITFVAGGRIALQLNENLTIAKNGRCKNTGKTTTCDLSFSLVPGAYRMSMTTYDGPLVNGIANGHELSKATDVPANITAKGPNDVKVALDGVVAGIAEIPIAPLVFQSKGDTTRFLMSRCATQASLDIYAVDADGYLIVGSGSPKLSVKVKYTELTSAGARPKNPNEFTFKRESGIPPAFDEVPIFTYASIGSQNYKGLFDIFFDDSICGVVTEYPIPTANSKPVGVGWGWQGLVWFTESGSGGVARINPINGSITEIPTNYPSSSPQYIIPGVDGVEWFTDAAGAIGEILANKGIVEIPVPTASSSPYGLSAGEDALYFTDRGTNSIGSMTHEGVFAEYPLPTANALPTEISFYPNSKAPTETAFWFGEAGADQVGAAFNLYSGGPPEILEFPAGGPVSSVASGFKNSVVFADGALNQMPTSAAPGVGGQYTPYALPGTPHVSDVFGYYDAIWFTDAGNNAVGSISLDGTIREYPVPTAAAGLRGLVVGPDGNIWFAECQANKIGRLQ